MNKTIKITTIALAFLGLAACGGNKQDDKKSATTTKKEAEKVQVLTLQSERIAKTLELSTTLEGYETMNISPSITGHIEHIYVQVGSRVQKGSMLVRMDQTQLNTTRINLASTKTELDRVTALKASGSVSEQYFTEPIEKTLYDEINSIKEMADYKTYLNELEKLNPTVTKFFEDVLVMDKDENVKNNRISLLTLLKEKYDYLADFSKL